MLKRIELDNSYEYIPNPRWIMFIRYKSIGNKAFVYNNYKNLLTKLEQLYVYPKLSLMYQ